MVSEIKPWIGYITVAEAEHDDVKIQEEVPNIVKMLTNVDTVEVSQGIEAGIVLDIGRHDDDIPDLERGTKVYYGAAYAVQLGEVKVVALDYIVAYEAP